MWLAHLSIMLVGEEGNNPNESPCSKLQGIKRDRIYFIPLTLTLSLREREFWETL